jgi:hypothetical protein
MFGLFVFVAVITIAFILWSIASVVTRKKGEVFHFIIIGVTILCIALSILLSQTAQTKMYWITFTAGAQKGTWIVIDNSGGKTIRHWVLYNNYVKGCDQSDGWEFFADSCAPCYVGGDSFVGKITDEQARGNYKKQFNIPENQIALH